MSISPTKDARGSIKTKSRKRPSHHLVFSDAISGALCRVKIEEGRRQNQPFQAPGNVSVLPEATMRSVLPTMPLMPFVHPAFGTRPMFYMLHAALIPRPDDMLSLPLGQHILDYEPRFFNLAFATFDGSTHPYDHMLYYNQVMILNSGNDRLLCKVFPTSLRGPTLALFYKLPRNSIKLFNELWAAFVSQYLCLMQPKRNISTLLTIHKQEQQYFRDFKKRFGQVVQ